MSDADRTTALVERLAEAARNASGAADLGDDAPARPAVVEVGIGERTAVAAALAESGMAVAATDVVDRSVPSGVTFVRDDVTDPDPRVYDAALIYALRLPPELHGAFAAAAASAGARAAFTTLGGDPPAVPTTPEQLPGGETIHWVAASGGGADVA